MARRAGLVWIPPVRRAAWMTFDADLTACAALVEKADPDRFASVMASPVAARKVLFPIYAFNVEVSRVPWVTQEPMIAEMRLQWWRDVLEEIASGGAVRRHEVATQLSEVIDANGARILDQLIVARRWDIYKEAFEDETQLDSYLSDTAGGLMWTAACALGADPTAKERVTALGRAAGFARFLSAVPALEKSGRIPLVDGRPDAVAQRARSALEAIDRRQVRRLVSSAAWPALTEAFWAQDILRQVKNDPHRVASGVLQVNPLLRSLRLWQWS